MTAHEDEQLCLLPFDVAMFMFILRTNNAT